MTRPRRTTRFTWFPHVSRYAFIDEMEEIPFYYRDPFQEEEFMIFAIGSSFWRQFSALSRGTQSHMLSVIQATPFDGMHFYETLPPRHGHINDFLRLCQALGSMPSVTKLEIKIDYRENDENGHNVHEEVGNVVDNDGNDGVGPAVRIHRSYIHAFTHLSHFHFSCSDNESDSYRQVEIRELAASLTGHPSLETVELSIPISWYSTIMPVLRTIPLLSKLVLRGNMVRDRYDGENILPESDAMEPIRSALLRRAASTDSELELELQRFDLTSERNRRGLADIIGRGSLKRLSVSSCLFDENDTMIPDALAESGLQAICIGESPFELPRLVINGIASMQHLRSLECIDHFVTVSRTLPLLVSAAAHLPSLVALDICAKNFSVALDQALSDCVRRNKSLREVQLQCIGRSGRGAVMLPMFEHALKDNYRIEYVSFYCDLLQDVDNLDYDSQTNIQLYVQLNLAGRGYVTTEPDNKRKGVEVMSRVVNDLNCLFVFLLGNPHILCLDAASETQPCASNKQSNRRCKSCLG